MGIIPPTSNFYIIFGISPGNLEDVANLCVFAVVVVVVLNVLEPRVRGNEDKSPNLSFDIKVADLGKASQCFRVLVPISTK